ncbi:Mov34/MPN/PAD-1 family protein [Pandoraea commovens]|uniref:Mov34/MPN/PAD-1 family protein n=1 Tax=Pandoraea commovens TaxID=2508289 RepID=UPI001581C6A0
MTFAVYRQLKPSDKEAGGILLGRRRGRHFEITAATTPFPTDSRTRTSFLREPNGHQEEATEHWYSSGHEVGYLGEWHTHPERAPTPSHTDVSQWHQSSQGMPGGLSFLAVIVGIDSYHVAVWRSGIHRITLESVHA